MKWRVDYIVPSLRDPKTVVIEATDAQFPTGGALVLTTTITERLPNGQGGVGDFDRTEIVAAFGPGSWIQVKPVRARSKKD